MKSSRTESKTDSKHVQLLRTPWTVSMYLIASVWVEASMVKPTWHLNYTRMFEWKNMFFLNKESRYLWNHSDNATSTCFCFSFVVSLGTWGLNKDWLLRRNFVSFHVTHFPKQIIGFLTPNHQKKHMIWVRWPNTRMRCKHIAYTWLAVTYFWKKYTPNRLEDYGGHHWTTSSCHPKMIREWLVGGFSPTHLKSI